ncbi:MAG: cache domain-containing protein [Candidatus Omnitrophica bacterium]|nr:cache domain-containing protein [Candidatus Omnitrophota bacterium]
MKTTSLKQKILFSFLIVIFVMSFFISLFRIYLIKINIVERAQNEVKNNLKAARTVYNSELEKIKTAFSIISRTDDLQDLKKKIGLDYLYVINREQAAGVKNEIVKQAFEGRPSGGSRIIGRDELKKMGNELFQRANIEIRFTPKAIPTELKVLDSAMAIEYALPMFDRTGAVSEVLYGGEIINRDFTLVDKIHDLVFENRLYASKPIGTVTIFQGDVRIATNVLDRSGNRAIGTRVSEKVYDTVVKNGRTWLDRAFVVTDWYLTSYEPIKDINGNIIGILYVGILEKPFNDMTRNVLLGFFAIILCVAVLAVILAFVLADSISKPLTEMLDATAKISGGKLEHKVRTKTKTRELNELAEAFNDMAGKLNERDRSLKVSNDKLAALNKSYLELIGFVAHELKGILSSTILNAYSVRDGFLGMINFKQRKALDSVARSLDYFASTIRNFLDLSTIEKEELLAKKEELLLKEDILDASVEAFSREASEKGFEVVNNVTSGVKIKGDRNLLQIAVNNLLGNALKYGLKGGRVVISARDNGDKIDIEVYNDGRPISEQEKEKLFRKFSRLENPETKKEKGTGLGLFITREIINKHGGDLRVEAREHGNAFLFQVEK